MVWFVRIVRTWPPRSFNDEALRFDRRNITREKHGSIVGSAGLLADPNKD